MTPSPELPPPSDVKVPAVAPLWAVALAYLPASVVMVVAAFLFAGLRYFCSAAPKRIVPYRIAFWLAIGIGVGLPMLLLRNRRWFRAEFRIGGGVASFVLASFLAVVLASADAEAVEHLSARLVECVEFSLVFAAPLALVTALCLEGGLAVRRSWVRRSPFGGAA